MLLKTSGAFGAFRPMERGGLARQRKGDCNPLKCRITEEYWKLNEYRELQMNYDAMRFQ